MIIIVNINAQKFSLNGIPYFKNFTPHVIGNKVRIINTYDSDFTLCELTNYAEFSVNGVTYTSVADLQTALLPVLFSRGTLGSSGGGSGTTPPLQDVLIEGNEFISADGLNKVVFNEGGIFYYSRPTTGSAWLKISEYTQSGIQFNINDEFGTGTKAEFDAFVGFKIYDGTNEIIIAPTSATKNGVEFATVNDISKLSYITITQPVDLDAIETRVNELDAVVILKGTWGAASGSFPASTQAGWSYLVTSDGTIDGVEFKNGDRLISVLDNASTSVYAGNWYKADYTDRVNTVCGRTGNVTITSSDLSDFNSSVNALITTALASFKTANYLDFTSSGQGQLNGKQDKKSWIISLDSFTGTSSTALQPLSNLGSSGNGSFICLANTKYSFEIEFKLSGMSSSAHIFSFGVLGTAGISKISGISLASLNANATSAGSTSFNGIASVSATGLVGTGSNTYGRAIISLEIETSTAGSVIMAFSTNVSTTPSVDYLKIIRTELGPVGTNATTDIV